MRITESHRWLLVAGAASFAASQLAGQAMSMSYRAATGREAPEDPNDRDFDWPTALIFGAAAGAVIGLAELGARRGALAGWRKVKGRRPRRS